MESGITSIKDTPENILYAQSAIETNWAINPMLIIDFMNVSFFIKNPIANGKQTKSQNQK